MKNFSSRKILVISILILILGLIGCSNDMEEDSNLDISEEVIITGLEDENITLSVDKVKSLKEVNKDVIAVSSSGEETEMNVSGGLLEELLNEYGKSQMDFSQIRFVASDGYSINVPSSILNSRDIILAYEINDEPLDEENLPLRIIIPEERAMYWVSNLKEIEIIDNGKEELEEKEDIVTKEIIFLETAIKTLDVEDYKDEDRAIKVSELLNEYGESYDDEIYIRAVDGLEKFENNKVFNDAYIKITGENAPMLTAPDMPEGMTIKNILFFKNDKQSFVSLDGFNKLESNESKYIELENIIREINLLEKEEVLITDISKETYSITYDELKSGRINIEEDGRINLELDSVKNIENILSIEID